MSASASGGIRFGTYVLLRRLARGGMAEVFLAQQKGLEGFDRRVAVKRILPHLADSPEFVKMFLGEARLAAQLSHPNVVHIYDFGKVESDYFIAMEFVDGIHAGKLFTYGQDHDRLSPTMIARLGADAAAALHHAHELRSVGGHPLGLVHRDVSPANIMVSFDGVVKLCDFGIAKAVSATEHLTNPGQVKGKYAYMSPEQVTAEPLDGRSDVFSLAIVLWELLVGTHIVERGDAAEAMRTIRDGKLPSIKLAAPRTPPALARAITWALQPDRERRATAMELAQALEAFIKSSPELATPMQLGAWIRKRFERDATGPHDAILAAEDPNDPNTAQQLGTQGGSVTSSAEVIAAARVSDPELDTPANATAAHGPRALAAAHSHEEIGVRPQLGRTAKLGSDPISEEIGVRPLLPAETGVRPQLGRTGKLGSDPNWELAAKRLTVPLVAVGVIGVLAIATFVMARRSSSNESAQQVTTAPIDAAPSVDALAPIVVDASFEPTFLEVRTKPAGATVRLGGETRIAPAKFALAPGSYTLIAELEGFASEKRTVELIAKVDLVQEIALVRKAGPIAPRLPAEAPTGTLTARTTPYSEVFHKGKRLGETPFADLSLPAGTYELTFKHPERAPLTRTVTITAGKTTKLSLDLP